MLTVCFEPEGHINPSAGRLQMLFHSTAREVASGLKNAQNAAVGIENSVWLNAR